MDVCGVHSQQQGAPEGNLGRVAKEGGGGDLRPRIIFAQQKRHEAFEHVRRGDLPRVYTRTHHEDRPEVCNVCNVCDALVVKTAACVCVCAD